MISSYHMSLSVFSPKLLFHNSSSFRPPTRPPPPQSQLMTVLSSCLTAKSRPIIRKLPGYPNLHSSYAPSSCLLTTDECPGCTIRSIPPFIHRMSSLITYSRNITPAILSLSPCPHQVFTMYWITLIRV